MRHKLENVLKAPQWSKDSEPGLRCRAASSASPRTLRSESACLFSL